MDTMTSEDDLLIGLVVGSLIYVFVTLIILNVFNGIIGLGLQPGSGFLIQIWNTWMMVGAILGVGDAAVIIAFVSDVFGGW